MLLAKPIYWALEGARVASDCLLLIRNCPANILIIIAFPCNKFAFLEIKLESRFSLICFPNIYFDRFCMCSENVPYKQPLCEGSVLYGVFVIIIIVST